MISGNKVHGDDTPIPGLAPGNGKTRTAQLWTDALRAVAFDHKNFLFAGAGSGGERTIAGVHPPSAPRSLMTSIKRRISAKC